MKPQQRGPAETPKVVRTALWINLALLVVAVAGPFAATSTDASALLFALPMSLILAIGAAAAIRAYILARRESRSMRWTSFLPIAVFLLGMVGTVVLVQTDAAWEKAPVEYRPSVR